MRCLGKELRADVKKAKKNGVTPLLAAAQEANLDVLRCLGKELGADVNKALNSGATPLFMAAQNGHLDVVRCLGKELGADINKARMLLYIETKMGNLTVVLYLAGVMRTHYGATWGPM